MKEGKIIAISNQKGGTAKTTSTFSLGVALAKKGQKVLLVDSDPQGDLTTYMGWHNVDEIPITLATLMQDSITDKDVNPKEAILHHSEGVDLIPSNLELSSLEVSLVNAMSREYTMKNVLNGLKKDYDYVLIDCMPNLGMITINALACADKVIIPVQSQFLATKGMGHLLQTVIKVRKKINPNLEVGGILLSLVDERTRLARNIRQELNDTYGMVFKITQGITAKIISIANITFSSKSTLPNSIITAIESCGFFESIPLWAVTLIGGLVVTVLSFIMIMTVYGRFFKLYLYTALAPIPLSSFAGEPTSNIGKSFLKSYTAVCLEGAIIVLSCIIFSLFASSPPVVDSSAATVTQVWNYIGELIFNMLVLVGTIKISDRIVREMMDYDIIFYEVIKYNIS